MMRMTLLIPATMPEMLPSILFGALVSSCVGVASYALCRFLEPRWKPGNFVVTIGILLQIMLICPVVGVCCSTPPGLGCCLLYGGLVVLGGWFHSKAGGASVNGGAASYLLFTACCVSLSVGLVPVVVILSSVMTPNWPAVVSYCLGLAFYPIFAPLALWTWQTLTTGSLVEEPVSPRSSAGAQPKRTAS